MDGKDGGVANGALLLRFTEAVLTRDRSALPSARQALADAMGAEAVVDAAAVIATFEGNVRIADATGIPLDPGSEQLRRKIGEALGVRDHTAVDD